jgi:hypothetical protein
VADRQDGVVHAVGEDRLRVEGIDQIDALVIGRAAEVVGAVQDDVARVRRQPRPLEHGSKRHAGPFADGTPALDAVVAGDLGARGHRAQLRERERLRRPDQAVDDEAIVGEVLRGLTGPLAAPRPRVAVGAEVGRHVGLGVFARQRRAAEQPLDAVAQPLARGQDLLPGRALAQHIAAREQARGATEREQAPAGQDNLGHLKAFPSAGGSGR